jgi:adenylate cyclase class IV
MTKNTDSIKEWEVKFFLNDIKVLNENHEPNSGLIQNLQLSNAERRDIQFIDTPNKDMYNDCWILRNRKKEKKDKYELTYKKRYPIHNDDIDSALTQAREDGLIQIDSKFEVELEWGYTKKGLSVSFEEKEPIPNSSSTTMPSIEELQKLFLNNAPKEFINWRKKNDWGIEQINKSTVCRPIYARVYEGKWNETKIHVEFWSRSINDHTETIVEVSFKVKDKAAADQLHPKLKDYLCKKNWLFMDDISKTEWAMKYCN